jgi:hypothetical protein
VGVLKLQHSHARYVIDNNLITHVPSQGAFIVQGRGGKYCVTLFPKETRRVQYDFFLHVQFRPNFHFVGVLKLFVLSVLVLGTQLFLKVRLI